MVLYVLLILDAEAQPRTQRIRQLAQECVQKIDNAIQLEIVYTLRAALKLPPSTPRDLIFIDTVALESDAQSMPAFQTFISPMVCFKILGDHMDCQMLPSAVGLASFNQVLLIAARMGKKSYDRMQAQIYGLLAVYTNGVLVIDEAGKVLYVNPSALILLSCTENALLGKALTVDYRLGENIPVAVQSTEGEKLIRVQSVPIEWCLQPAVMVILYAQPLQTTCEAEYAWQESLAAEHQSLLATQRKLTIEHQSVVSMQAQLEAEHGQVLKLKQEVLAEHREICNLKKKLGESRQHVDLILDSSSDGFWDWDLYRGKIFFSSRWREHLGYASEARFDTFMVWRDLIHPDDLGYFLVTLCDYIDTQDQGNVKFEYRIRSKAGFYRWVQIRACKAQDTGQVYRLAGSHDDITERKEEERELLTYQTLLESKVANRTQALEQAKQELEKLASLDGLTGLKNRRCLDERLTHEFHRTLRSNNPPLGLIMLDIDFFKAYNDAYGHLQGDECLKAVAKALQQSVMRTTDFVARYGGEEFCVLVSSTTLSGVLKVAERIRTTIEMLHDLPSNPQTGHGITVSLGVASTTKAEYSTCSQLIHAADGALYQAKKKGRNCVVRAE